MFTVKLIVSLTILLGTIWNLVAAGGITRLEERELNVWDHIKCGGARLACVLDDKCDTCLSQIEDVIENDATLTQELENIEGKSCDEAYKVIAAKDLCTDLEDGSKEADLMCKVHEECTM